VQKLFEIDGLSFSQFVRRRRMERAGRALSDPLGADTSIADVGFAWGYADPAHFSRAFREHHGVSPSTFRKQVVGEAETSLPTRGRPGQDARTTRQGLVEAGDPPERLVTPAGRTDVSDRRHHHLPANARTIHWGYFSRSLPPVLTVRSGDTVTVETLTQHATDDAARMIEGDDGAQSVFGWTPERKNVERRGAGPLDASIYGRGAGEGFGVHICTGPIAIEGAAPGDILEVSIEEIVPRPSRSAPYAGRSFGSNGAVWWGYHYKELLTEPRPREVVTLYELERDGARLWARALYSFRWTPQRDPNGVMHATIDYPGVPVDHATVEKDQGVLAGVRVPLRPHFGIVAVAPNRPGIVDSTPPSAFGGNIDNWRLGAGSRLYLPVAVAGALLSIGDPHAAQGDGELSGTAIECSLTGRFRLSLHRGARGPAMLRDLTYPLIETDEAWIVQGFSFPNYLAELGDAALSEVYKRSSLDNAMRDAFRKARRLLMVGCGFSEDEAISLLSVGVDFGITQVVDGNLGVHAVISKEILKR
jgi:acetamidase/formamidase